MTNPSVLWQLGGPLTLPPQQTGQVVYFYLTASQTVTLPAAAPGMWLTVQNSTWVATGAYTLTIAAANLFTGVALNLTNGQAVRLTAVDLNGAWVWALV